MKTYKTIFVVLHGYRSIPKDMRNMVEVLEKGVGAFPFAANIYAPRLNLGEPKGKISHFIGMLKDSEAEFLHFEEKYGMCRDIGEEVGIEINKRLKGYSETMVWFVAHSMGTMVALEAMKHVDRKHSSVLVSFNGIAYDSDVISAINNDGLLTVHNFYLERDTAISDFMDAYYYDTNSIIGINSIDHPNIENHFLDWGPWAHSRAISNGDVVPKIITFVKKDWEHWYNYRRPDAFFNQVSNAIKKSVTHLKFIEAIEERRDLEFETVSNEMKELRRFLSSKI